MAKRKRQVVVLPDKEVRRLARAIGKAVRRGLVGADVGLGAISAPAYLTLVDIIQRAHREMGDRK